MNVNFVTKRVACESSAMSRNDLECLVYSWTLIFSRFGIQDMRSRCQSLVELAERKLHKDFKGFGGITPGVSRKRFASGLTRQQIDQITIQCAVIASNHYSCDIHDDSSLSQIRAFVVDAIYEFGYESIHDLCTDIKPFWRSYKVWEDVARADGLNDEQIKRLRHYVSELDPENFVP